jgi:hypothetical protein
MEVRARDRTPVDVDGRLRTLDPRSSKPFAGCFLIIFAMMGGLFIIARRLCDRDRACRLVLHAGSSASRRTRRHPSDALRSVRGVRPALALCRGRFCGGHRSSCGVHSWLKIGSAAGQPLIAIASAFDLSGAPIGHWSSSTSLVRRRPAVRVRPWAPILAPREWNSRAQPDNPQPTRRGSRGSAGDRI